MSTKKPKAADMQLPLYESIFGEGKQRTGMPVELVIDDLHPFPKQPFRLYTEEKMREINEAYTQALQYKRNGGHYSDPNQGSSPYGSSPYGNPYGNPFGSYYSSGGSGGAGGGGFRSNTQEDPFSAFGFGPFSAFFGGAGPYGSSTQYRERSYANPDLETAGRYVLSRRFIEAISLLNQIPTHDADWHALYARADFGLGNRISALDHARAAVRMQPQDPEYQTLLSAIESGRQSYRRAQADGYDFRSAICSNPCLTCFATNIILNCCLGGCGRYGASC